MPAALSVARDRWRLTLSVGAIELMPVGVCRRRVLCAPDQLSTLRLEIRCLLLSCVAPQPQQPQGRCLQSIAHPGGSVCCCWNGYAPATVATEVLRRCCGGLKGGLESSLRCHDHVLFVLLVTQNCQNALQTTVVPQSGPKSRRTFEAGIRVSI